MSGVSLEPQPFPVMRAAQLEQTPAEQRWLVATLGSRDVPIRRTELRKLLAVNNRRLGEALTALETLGRIQRTPKGWTRSTAAPSTTTQHGGR